MQQASVGEGNNGWTNDQCKHGCLCFRRENRKPRRKLGCGNDNGPLFTHAAHQSRLICRDSSLDWQVKLTNICMLIQRPAGQSMAYSMTNLSMWGSPVVSKWDSISSIPPYIAVFLLILIAWHNPTDHPPPSLCPMRSLFLSLLSCSRTLFFSNLMWQPSLPTPYSSSRAQRRQGQPDVTGGVNRVSRIGHKEPGGKKKVL